MAELIPEISITDFRKLIKDIDKLKQLKSCEVTYDGEYLFTFVNPQTDYVRLHTENTANLGNCISGKNPDEIFAEAGIL